MTSHHCFTSPNPAFAILETETLWRTHSLLLEAPQESADRQFHKAGEASSATLHLWEAREAALKVIVTEVKRQQSVVSLGRQQASSHCERCSSRLHGGYCRLLSRSLATPGLVECWRMHLQ